MDHINATTGYEVKEEQGKGRIEWKNIPGVRVPGITLEIRTAVDDDGVRDEWGLNHGGFGAMNRFEAEMFHRALDHALWVMGKLEEEERV